MIKAGHGVKDLVSDTSASVLLAALVLTLAVWLGYEAIADAHVIVMVPFLAMVFLAAAGYLNNWTQRGVQSNPV